MVVIIIRDELKTLLEKKEECILIDVREPDELVYGMLPTAKNLPLSEWGSVWVLSSEEFVKKYHFPLMKKDDKIVVYCKTGGRSARAAAILQKNGFTDVCNFAGSIWAWAEIDPSVKRYGSVPG